MGKLLDNLRKKQAATSPKTNRHTVNFLAHKDDIAEAMREGWTTRQIWEQMIEDGLTSMSYATLCRLAKKHITSCMDDMDDANGAASFPGTPSRPSPAVTKSRSNSATIKTHKPEKRLTEKERLDLMKKEAFASVRSTKKTGPLIGKPKSRDEENRELFGE